MLSLAAPTDALAFGPFCFTTGEAGGPSVACNDPAARSCHTNGDPGVCGAFGFTATGPQDFHYCVEPTCTSTLGAAVPELEDYAAALFLGIALIAGWRVRRANAPAG